MITARLSLFCRLMLKPLAGEPVRTALTVLAVALGVAVVLAMDLAGDAATGSFHSSLEALSGDQTLEISATGGVPEGIVGKLSALPYDWRVTPRMEDFAVIAESKKTLPLIGLDLVAESGRFSRAASAKEEAGSASTADNAETALQNLTARDSIWVGESLGKRPGETLQLFINDRPGAYIIRGTFPDSNGNESAIVMDIAAAQLALGRPGRVDRVYLRVPPGDTSASLDEWQRRAEQALPEGVQAHAAGASTNENRKMLAAFRWNLRLLSYIALVVGAFLIYNTISVSVVRRRAEIGIARALGASRRQVLTAFLGEAAFLGLAGALVGLPLGRIMAGGAVKLMAATVQLLYVSSRPGAIVLTPYSLPLALLIGIGVAVLSAVSPAREATQVSPVDAMAQGRREYIARAHKGRDLAIAVALTGLAALAARMPAFAGKPFFGYLAAILLIAAAAYAMPALVNFISQIAAGVLGKLLGVEAMLASRSLAGSLRRTSVLVGALATAVAMMVSVGIMVGSFRQTVVSWMDHQLPADLYLRPAG